MAIDYSAQEQLEENKRVRDAARLIGESTGNGDGGPPGDDTLLQRVRALETNTMSIDKTLAVMSEQLKHLASKDDIHALQSELNSRTSKMETDLATIVGKLERKSDATDLAELKGRVARIPTVPVLTSILIFVSLLFTAAAWALRHLPPAWAAALS